MKVRLITLPATLALLLAITLPGSVLAQHSHGVLTPGVTFPQDDAVLRDAPRMITMSFRVDVKLLKLALYTSTDQWINIGFAYEPERNDRSYVYQIPGELPESDYYIARWSVTDGRRGLLSGEFKFSLRVFQRHRGHLIEGNSKTTFRREIQL